MTYIGNDGKDEKAHFIRQRRNLVLISLFILFYKVGNLKVDTISFLGNQTSIGNPEIITFSLGVFFTYFFWRYYTSCREIGGVRNFWSLCTSWAEDETQKHVQRKEFGKKKIQSSQIALILRETGARTYLVSEGKDNSLSQDKKIKVRFYYSFMKIFSIIPTIFKTSSFSEYLLPYVMAGLVIAEFLNVGIVNWSMVFIQDVIGQQNIESSIVTEDATTLAGVTKALAVTIQTNGECLARLLDVCFVEPNSLSATVSVFGFAEFATALALLVIVYTFSDIRYRFRLSVAPVPVFLITYICIFIIGFGTLLTDVWGASQWPVPDWLVTKHMLQGIFGLMFLFLALIWIFYAFIRPPVFGKKNAKRYAHKFLNIIMEGTEKELPVIAHELGQSAKNIVEIARRAPSSMQSEEENKKAKPSAPPTAEDYAYEILLMMGTRRLCRHIISSAPVTAMEFFKCFSDNLHKSLPVGQFVRNISTEAIINKDSLLYHEDEGHISGWLGYVRPFSEAIYGDYSLISMLSNNRDSSPLDLHYKTAWGLDAEQLSVYSRAVLITLEAYIKNHKSGCTKSFALNNAFEFLTHSAQGIYKLDGVKDYYPNEAYAKLDVSVNFVNDAIRILNKHSIPDDRLKTRPEFGNKDIYDQIAKMMFEIILAASGVKSPRDTCWSIHYNAVWSQLFSFVNEGKAQKIIYHRLRRLLYDEICELSDLPNYKSAGILAICLNVLGPVIRKRGTTIGREDRALHVVMIAWLKNNYIALREKQPDVANACVIGSITYEEDTKRLAKSYRKGLRLEEPKEYLELDGSKDEQQD